MRYLLRRFQLPKLHRFNIRGGDLPYKICPRFLNSPADTLELITFANTIMSKFDEEETNQGFWDRDFAPNWFNIFEIMLKMPRLMAAQIAGLAQDYNSAGRTEHNDPAAPGSTCLDAYGSEISVKLGHCGCPGNIRKK
jgi:hypothetical protein